MQRQALADVYGNADIPIYCLNVAYPLVPDELVDFCVGKEQVLVLEEGQPEYIEQGIQTVLRRRDVQTRVFGKDIMPMAGEYTGQVMLEGITRFVLAFSREDVPLALDLSAVLSLQTPLEEADIAALMENLPPRPAGLCTGCPERPLFSAIKQVQEELGPFHISSDIGCHSFATAAPFNLGNTLMGYGLSLASSSGMRHALPHKAISIMGDGGFWHNGLTSGVTSAVFNGHDGLLIIIDNGYSAATGGQDIPSLVEPSLIPPPSMPSAPAGSSGRPLRTPVAAPASPTGDRQHLQHRGHESDAASGFGKRLTRSQSDHCGRGVHAQSPAPGQTHAEAGHSERAAG